MTNPLNVPLDEEVAEALLRSFSRMEEELPDVVRDPFTRASLEALVYQATGHRERAIDALMRSLDDDDMERTLYVATCGWMAVATKVFPGSDPDDLLLVETDSADDDTTAAAAFMSALGSGDRDAALVVWKQVRDDPEKTVAMAIECLNIAALLLRYRIDEAMAA